jgi:hypothetical protein
VGLNRSASSEEAGGAETQALGQEKGIQILRRASGEADRWALVRPVITQWLSSLTHVKGSVSEAESWIFQEHFQEAAVYSLNML